MMSGCRITQQTRECVNLGIFSHSKSSSLLKNYQTGLKTRRFCSNSSVCRNRNAKIAVFPLLLVNSLQSKTPGDLPSISDCFSKKEDEHELSSDSLASVQGGIVALGKFDALHIGHRELAIQASKVGAPFLLSFVGIAEVLGWEPRAPIVAKCDRRRVLSSWASCCDNMTPKEFLIEFSSVRHLNPRQFVEKLSKEFGIRGVVAGQNYRFGYKASGSASDLVRLCDEYGIGAYIINSVMDKNQNLENSLSEGTKETGQVSSTRVRYALAKGDISYVNELLGRRHRIMLSMENKEGIISTQNRISVPRSSLLNLPPKDGFYKNCLLISGDGCQLECEVAIDPTSISLDMNDRDKLLQFADDFRPIGIEFADG
ncbi:hypothetical protein V2J09_005911 [Rumex salicifolius]